MPTDPIVAEIRRVREAFAERFAGDLEAMAADIIKREPATVVNRSGREIDEATPVRDLKANVSNTAK